MRRLDQNQIILNALKEGEVLDSRSALHKYGVKSLGTIISNLRREGYYFDKSYEPWGNRRRLTRYELRQNS